MTVGELVAAMQMAREVGEAQQKMPGEAKIDGAPVADPATAADENITSLSSARYTK
jgi:hypothetical protein